MSDRMAAEIWIGGRIAKQLVPKLCDAISSQGASLDWDEGQFSPGSATELVDACQDEDGVRLLHLCNVEACWGEFGELEEFLVRRKIAFRRRSEAKYEHDAVVIEFRPAIGLVRYPTDSSGKPYVPLADMVRVGTALDSAVQSARGESTAKVLGRLRNVRRLLNKSMPVVVPPLEPFEIVGQKARKEKSRGR